MGQLVNVNKWIWDYVKDVLFTFLDFIIITLWILKESPYHLEIFAEVYTDKMTQQGMEVGIGHNR